MLGGAVVLVPGAAEAANRRPVFGWERFGGFVAPGTDPLAAPRLVVYGDGLAVADATRSLVLSPRVKSEIRNRAVAVLSNPDNLRRRPGTPVIVDAPQTRFTATASHRRYTGVVDALEEYRAYRGYPKPLYDLLDDATALRDRILGTGKLFRPAAVRLVVLRLDAPIDPHTPVRAWPAGVAIPPMDADRRTGQADLHGNAARRVIAGIGTPSSGVWQTFRTARGVLLQAAWRYLLPHE
jgi:hypothetical protein